MPTTTPIAVYVSDRLAPADTPWRHPATGHLSVTCRYFVGRNALRQRPRLHRPGFDAPVGFWCAACASGMPHPPTCAATAPHTANHGHKCIRPSEHRGDHACVCGRRWP